jgi:glutathione S-transferase
MMSTARSGHTHRLQCERGKCIDLSLIHLLMNRLSRRFLLNYKGLPYKTEWVLHENVKANNQALGLEPTSTQFPQWTLPAIRDARPGTEPVAIADSVKIADYLEATYPERPLATAALRASQKAHTDTIDRCILANLLPIVVPNAVENLDGSNRIYFTESRPSVIGTAYFFMLASTDVGSPGTSTEQDHEALWVAFRAGMDELAAYINGIEHGERSFFSAGSEPIYADLHLASFFPILMLGSTSPWEAVKDWNDGLWARAYDEYAKYLQTL